MIYTVGQKGYAFFPCSSSNYIQCIHTHFLDVSSNADQQILFKSIPRTVMIKL